MSDEMRAVGNDEPLMIAWKAYKETPEYANSRKWAENPDHTEGSLWAAFTAGFLAGGGEYKP